MSDAKVNSEDTEMVFQRLRALPGNKVNIFEIVFVNIGVSIKINNKFKPIFCCISKSITVDIEKSN